MPNIDENPQLIDIREDDLLALSAEVLDTLLRDHTTGKNIFWATHDYEALGTEYDYHSEILPHLITGKHGMVIRPRVLKSKGEQTDRAKDMAEVFTPSWIVKKMVNYLDIDINTRCLELTCGEAPFLVSRYDSTTGEHIAINERIGVLDRKLRMVNEQQLSDDEWIDQVRQAFQSTYGYEWQGDSLLLARENLLYTFIDYYEARFGSTPDIPFLQDFAEIISWNLWQMDGLTYRIPREKHEEQAQLSFFDAPPIEPPAPFCKIKDWQKEKTIKVNDIKKRQTKNQDIMKFDVIIGNPPYQEELEGTSNPPIYNFFMDESYKNAQIVELITPARWLFNAGKTPAQWNRKMLADNHLKVLYYEPISGNVFSNTGFKGGVAVTYRDEKKTFGSVGDFALEAELRSITNKVHVKMKTNDIRKIIIQQNKFNLGALYEDYPQYQDIIGSKGTEKRLTTPIFEQINLFSEHKIEGYVQIIGLIKNIRHYRYISPQYLDKHDNLYKYKVIVAASNGDGIFGELLSNPFVGSPGLGYTQSFLGFGNFETREEAEATLKYLKTKFARGLLGTLKKTQHNHTNVWANIPLQDFTNSSDIDWSKSIVEIDEQLFDKYGLDEKERNFIRTKVKEMV